MLWCWRLGNCCLLSSGAEASDNPLPLALGMIVGKDSWLYHLLGHCRFISPCSILPWNHFSCVRDFEFGRPDYFKALGKAHPKFETPMMAPIANMQLASLPYFLEKQEIYRLF